MLGLSLEVARHLDQHLVQAARVGGEVAYLLDDEGGEACEVAGVAVVLDAEVGDVKGDRGLGLQHELVVRLWDVRLRGVCGAGAAQLLIA